MNGINRVLENAVAPVIGGLFLLLTVTFTFSTEAVAQSPEGMSYQAVVRDMDNALVTNTEVGMQITILQGSEEGEEVYVETHLPTTNDNGLVSLVIGNGNAVLGDFADINWSEGPYFIKTETDVEGGTQYTISGVQQLLSVPYALYALESGSDEELPVGNQVGDMMYWDGEEWEMVNAGNHANILYFCDGVPTWGGCAPLVETNSVVNITALHATVNSTVTHDGGGTVTARGVVWDNEPNPTLVNNFTDDGDGLGDYVSVVTGLKDNTTFYVRAYATNENGTHYGNQIEFSTPDLLVSDIDGNSYETVIIGNQEWMAENLRTTRFRNGDTIPLVLNDSVWFQTSSSAYSYYDNDSMYIDDYGFLYNWYAARNFRGLCPEGWRVPTDSDWDVLVEYLGGRFEAGGKLKTTGIIEVGTGLWQDPNEGATNESGFSAIPGGHRLTGGQYQWIRRTATFWNHTELNDTSAWTRRMSYNNSEVIRANQSKGMGFSVRCMRD